MKILVISSSLDPASRSRILAAHAFKTLEALGVTADFLNLRDYPLPLCDGDAAYEDANAKALKQKLSAADAFIVAVPVYNFDVNAAVKNLVELTGRAWENKVAAFLCAAGGRASYMSVMSFASSLMLDFRTLIVPRFVYALGSDFDDTNGTIVNDDIRQRTEDLARETAALAQALRNKPTLFTT